MSHTPLILWLNVFDSLTLCSVLQIKRYINDPLSLHCFFCVTCCGWKQLITCRTSRAGRLSKLVSWHHRLQRWTTAPSSVLRFSNKQCCVGKKTQFNFFFFLPWWIETHFLSLQRVCVIFQTPAWTFHVLSKSTACSSQTLILLNINGQVGWTTFCKGLNTDQSQSGALKAPERI